MTLPKFVLGMAIVFAIVTLWSFVDSAGWGTILLRIIFCAAILQVGYFLAVLAMVLRSGPKQIQGSAVTEVEAPAVPSDDLTPKGSAH